MESMVNVEFNLNQKITTLQTKLDEPFQFIIEQYIKKSLIEPNSVYFIVNSKPIEPKQTIENHMNDIDKQNNKITVFVNRIFSKDIICPECKEPCRFTIDNYKIKLFDCIHNHKIDNIKLSDFYETQKNETPGIICASCKNTNTNDNEFYECLTCNEIFCFLCK